MIKAAEKVLIRLIQIAIVLITASTAWYFCPPARFYVLGLMDRAYGCTARQVAETSDVLERQLEWSRYFERQMRTIETDAAGFHLMETPKGRFWVPVRSKHNLPYLLAEQEESIYGKGRQGVQSGDVVLDCGAHVGVFTRRALSDGAILVVAVEFSPQNVECLLRNFREEIESGRVIVSPKGVWYREESLPLRQRRGSSLDDSVVLDGEDFDTRGYVSLTTIDRLVEELGLERVDFIKLDVEGAEEKALTGAERTLAKHRPRLAVATENFRDQPERISAAVRRAWPGYRVECRYCLDHSTWIQPHVLYFR